MSVRRKIKRTTKQYILVACICIFIMGGAAVITAVMITQQVKSRYSTLLLEAQQEMEANKRTVYVATSDVIAGDYIMATNVMEQSVYASQPVDTYMTSEDIGKVALISIKMGTQLLKGMLSENSISSELRELEYSVINISANIASNDTVDVRISYPNGETYVVLSKKIIKGYIPDTAICYFWINEEELLRMSAAIVDASIYSGSSLYVTKYIEPNLQAASLINYTPSLSVLSLLENDPNILMRATQELGREVRKSLENRLADSLKSDVSSISWDLDPNAHLSNIPSKLSADDANIEDRQLGEEENVITEPGEELGSILSTDNYFYYAEEEVAKEEDIEYGE